MTIKKIEQVFAAVLATPEISPIIITGIQQELGIFKDNFQQMVAEAKKSENIRIYNK